MFHDDDHPVRSGLFDGLLIHLLLVKIGGPLLPLAILLFAAYPQQICRFFGELGDTYGPLLEAMGQVASSWFG